MKSNNKKVLEQHLGDKEKAKEVLRLTSNYDKYIAKFKIEMNKLLEPVNYEVKAGLVFVPKNKVQEK